MHTQFKSLLLELKAVHEDLLPISTDIVVVADWVRWKCRYGCRAYGKHLCCPPYSPRPQETRAMLSSYSHAVLVRFRAEPDLGLLPEHTHHALWRSITSLHRTISALERRAFLLGCYKAFGMGALPCTLCERCVAEDGLEKGTQALIDLEGARCRHKDVMRPSMEACGIDVFQTLRNAGFGPEVLKDYAGRVELIGMVLLD